MIIPRFSWVAQLDEPNVDVLQHWNHTDFQTCRILNYPHLMLPVSVGVSESIKMGDTANLGI